MIHKGIGREKYHVIAVPVLHHFVNVTGNIVVFFLGSSAELASHIPGDQYGTLLGIKHRVGIHLVILLLTAQQVLVILDGQEGSGKKDRTASSEHAFLQVFSGIHAEQLQFKAAILTQSGIFHIVFILSLVNIQKMTELEIEVQQILPYFQADLLLLLQIITDHSVQSGQGLHQHVNIIHQPVPVTVPLHGQQLCVTLLQQLADPFRIAFPHKGTLSVRLFPFVSPYIEGIGTVCFLQGNLLWQLF